MRSRELPWSIFLAVVVALACDPPAAVDGGTADASTPMDGALNDGGADAGATDGGRIADADPCDRQDGGEDAGEVDAALDGGPSPCGAPRLPRCSGAVAARDFRFTMVTELSGSSVSANVRGRNYVEGGELREQRAREAMTTGGVASTLLRVWSADAEAEQLLYTLEPPTPHPFTLVPHARRQLVSSPVSSPFNSLPNFPQYSTEALACLDAADVVACMEAGGLLFDAGESEVDGAACREMRLGPEESMTTVCVPASCEARRTLYPLRLRGPGVEVFFRDLAPDSHDDGVVEEPAPCELVTGLDLCTLPAHDGEDH